MHSRSLLSPLARAALLLALLLATAPAMAWGRLGHRLVAQLAWDGMTPAARAAALDLLQDEPDPSLAGVANWADELRANDPGLGRRSASWHYVNLAEDGCHYDVARDCPRGNCVVAAIEAQAAILADPARPREDRVKALKFVVHFVGDVHQPLHAGFAHDKGGNTVQVNLDGRGSNLHALWDSGLLEQAGRDEAQWLEHLRGLPLRQGAGLGPSDWAEASCRIVRSPGFYPGRAKIDEEYGLQWSATASRQLRLGGEHLARVLNGALGG
ncbi:S1/P1 nuclease [Lysobacter sp. SG-8]|uniref:S1/P1 nuclease n=1 Tax=Marilutibacter penaei TaxID=2759900 RepID=A0A7W3U3J7_9GAMM|nr:S1/P1 nuclease [Lysobacter penaei]MBB1088281.1 S1/P1 nuclease [Lysobacter penaei]